MEINLIVFSFVIICASVLASNNSTLLSVVVIFRHGDRTPTKFAPLDPYKDPKYWTAGTEQLTNTGVQQEYDLGKWLRQRYEDFLPSKYNREDIYVKSSNADRCLMSAAANLAGLYPPVGDQIWNPNLPWRPIPIHTKPKKKDTIFKMAKACPRYEKVYKKLLKSRSFKDMDAANRDLYSYLGKNLGVEIASFTDIEEWYDTFKVEELHNLTLLNWTRSVYPEPMRHWTHLTFQLPTYTTELSRFGTGPFFDTIATHFVAASTNSTEGLLTGKMVLLSGHQTNICDISNTLGVFRSGPYASALIFELRLDTESYRPFVKLFYKTQEEVEVLRIRNCSVECDLKNFLSIVEPIRMDDKQAKKECEK